MARLVNAAGRPENSPRDTLPIDRTSHARTPAELLRVGADARQVLRDTRIQADDPLRKLVYRRDQGQPYGGHDQSIFDQILALLFLEQTNEKRFHNVLLTSHHL